MIKNYVVLVLIIFSFFPGEMLSQEIRIFTIADFDLKGKVKSCLVSTNYGKEEYDFNEEGVLSKSVTRYSDTDYTITYYKYDKGMLLEKRLENYQDNTFDKSTSMANFYTIDSVANLKVIEKIVSYDKDFLEQYEYFYDTDNTLVKIIRTNNEGTDETTISQAVVKNEKTTTYLLNEVLQESIRASAKQVNDSLTEKTVLTKKFLAGEPHTALEELFDGRNKLESKTKFFYNAKTKRFAKEETVKYTYDESGMLLTTQSGIGAASKKKVYVYQFDEHGNWIKEVITPDNTYTTRKISYYDLMEEAKKG